MAAVGWAIFRIGVTVVAVQPARNLDRGLPVIEQSLRQLNRMPAVRRTAEQARIAEKIAKALGLTIPQSVLLRADQVIE